MASYTLALWEPMAVCGFNGSAHTGQRLRKVPAGGLTGCRAFPLEPFRARRLEQSVCKAADGPCHSPGPESEQSSSRRRDFVAALALSLAVVTSLPGPAAADSLPVEAKKPEFADMPALRGKDYGKTKMKYPDYVETSTGLQYKDLRDGSGRPAEKGDMVVIDWDGFTIGYYGRIFEARNKAKGGSFEGNEKDFYRFRLGVDKVIPAFEEAIQGMQVGGIRRIIVPPELGYPENDYRKAGPAPLTFSGQRTLSFVLENSGLIDKTLLFDIELLRIVPGDGGMK